ncbi:hypothetical protein, partial [Cronobacter sakazakii]|uniref:hypothetical protein n=1 Tax=Cronobacter sakazakii TaxID=28141 RepID=UPI001F2B8FA3
IQAYSTAIISVNRLSARAYEIIIVNGKGFTSLSACLHCEKPPPDLCNDSAETIKSARFVTT